MKGRVKGLRFRLESIETSDGYPLWWGGMTVHGRPSGKSRKLRAQIFMASRKNKLP